MTKTEIAQAFQAAQRSRDAAAIDALAEHIADDCTMQAGRMGGEVSGKAAIIERLKSPPQGGGGGGGFGGGGGGGGMGQMTPEPPVEEGNTVKIKTNLPPGAPVSAMTMVFTFNDDSKLSRVERQMA